MSTFSRIAISVLGIAAAAYFSGCVAQSTTGASEEHTGESAEAAGETCRRVPIPATDSADCLDSPPGCSIPAWNSVTGCSIVVDPACICYEDRQGRA
jgi:hypothetical protein